jgi:hypothetical protein
VLSVILSLRLRRNIWPFNAERSMNRGSELIADLSAFRESGLSRTRAVPAWSISYRLLCNKLTLLQRAEVRLSQLTRGSFQGHSPMENKRMVWTHDFCGAMPGIFSGMKVGNIY